MTYGDSFKALARMAHRLPVRSATTDGMRTALLMDPDTAVMIRTPTSGAPRALRCAPNAVRACGSRRESSPCNRASGHRRGGAALSRARLLRGRGARDRGRPRHALERRYLGVAGDIGGGADCRHVGEIESREQYLHTKTSARASEDPRPRRHAKRRQPPPTRACWMAPSRLVVIRAATAGRNRCSIPLPRRVLKTQALSSTPPPTVGGVRAAPESRMRLGPGLRAGRVGGQSDGTTDEAARRAWPRSFPPRHQSARTGRQPTATACNKACVRRRT